MSRKGVSTWRHLRHIRKRVADARVTAVVSLIDQSVKMGSATDTKGALVGRELTLGNGCHWNVGKQAETFGCAASSVA